MDRRAALKNMSLTLGYAVEEGVHNWKNIWMFPAVFAIAVFAFFAIFFKNEKIEFTE